TARYCSGCPCKCSSVPRSRPVSLSKLQICTRVWSKRETSSLRSGEKRPLPGRPLLTRGGFSVSVCQRQTVPSCSPSESSTLPSSTQARAWIGPSCPLKTFPAVPVLASHRRISPASQPEARVPLRDQATARTHLLCPFSSSGAGSPVLASQNLTV